MIRVVTHEYAYRPTIANSTANETHESKTPIQHTIRGVRECHILNTTSAKVTHSLEHADRAKTRKP